MKKYIGIVILFFAIGVLICAPAAAKAAALPSWNDYIDYATDITTLSPERIKELMAETKRSTKIPFQQFNMELLQEVYGPKLNLNTIALDAGKIKKNAQKNKILAAAIGQFFNYVVYNNRQSLDNAVLLTNQFGNTPSSLDGYSYWRLLMNAYSELDYGRIEDFKESIYKIWVEEIIPLKREQDIGYDTVNSFSAELGNVCNSVLNLVINKAILSESVKVKDLYPLGGAVEGIFNINAEDDKNDKVYKAVMEHYTGLESDSANIVYSVYFAKALQFSVDAINGGPEISRLGSLKSAVENYNAAREFASTSKGELAALKNEAVLLTSMVANLFNGVIREDREAVKAFVFDSIKDNVRYCLNKYRTVAKVAGPERLDEISKYGVDNPAEYITQLKDIWQATAMLVRFQSDLVKKEGSNTDFLKKRNAEMIGFATYYFSTEGYEDLIPDSAYFETSYNAKLLSEIALDVAMVRNTKKNIRDAVALQAYSLLLNPYGINDLYNFSLSYLGKPVGTTSEFMMFLEPIGTGLHDSIKLCVNDDRYVKEQKSIKYLGDYMPVLISALPQVVGTFTARGAENITREFIITAGVYNALYQEAKKAVDGNPRLIAKNDIKIFSEENGAKHPRETIEEVTSVAIRNNVLQRLDSTNILNPANYSALYEELENSPADRKHIFLKRLYAEQSKLASEPEYAGIRELRKSVRKYCENSH
ncbi:hypothetical protein [Maridesulfovibrio sp.]|uniref:hypothetical protein n=1 Tax=Maridesulfovibrio sp. TaxID=2795000 RepID=UPI0029CA786A|nr:hypothetical protein [Maridesulfovibrio sp.]